MAKIALMRPTDLAPGPLGRQQLGARLARPVLGHGP
jgi:hypothetical protein